MSPPQSLNRRPQTSIYHGAHDFDPPKKKPRVRVYVLSVIGKVWSTLCDAAYLGPSARIMLLVLSGAAALRSVAAHVPRKLHTQPTIKARVTRRFRAQTRVALSSSSLAPLQPSRQPLVALCQRNRQRRRRPSGSRLVGACRIGSSDGACVRHRIGSSAGAAPVDQPCSRRYCLPAATRRRPCPPLSCWQACRGDPVARCGRFEPFT